jgi:cobalamin transport system substrate-binding protein
VHRLTLAIFAALVAALAVVSLSAAARQQTRAMHRPHRIISLSPTMTENLFAIGAGKQVIAVDEDSNYPRRAPRTKLSGFTPNVEAIAKYHPDLVVISYNPANFASQLRKLGIKVVDEPAVNDIGRAYKEILGLGRLTGHLRGARAVVSTMRTRLAAIVASVPKSRRHLRV